VPKDAASPMPVEGYVVAFMTFYERGFCVPLHRFLHSLLQHYGLELHHLTYSGVLHIEAFLTLCEALMVIGPHFNLWNHFFRIWLLLVSDVEVAVSGGVAIHVKYV
jgi:hypothetical protein